MLARLRYAIESLNPPQQQEFVKLVEHFAALIEELQEHSEPSVEPQG